MSLTIRQGATNNSPLKGQGMFVTDGGLETTLVFHHGMDLPHFAAFDLLKSQEGYALLRDYYQTYAQLALKYEKNFLLESPTWRANADWGILLGYDQRALDHINVKAIALMRSIKLGFESEPSRFLISGCIGPRGDGYLADTKMTAEAATEYHQNQVNSFFKSGVDIVTAVTMTYPEEALGVAQACAKYEMPVAISFTLETNGKLPSGHTLEQAIIEVDDKAGIRPAYYMINCAHPSHFFHILNDDPGTWRDRIYGIRANASQKSHAELEESFILDEGDPKQLGEDYLILKTKLKNLQIIGGCCGTDYRHVEAICQRLF